MTLIPEQEDHSYYLQDRGFGFQNDCPSWLSEGRGWCAHCGEWITGPRAKVFRVTDPADPADDPGQPLCDGCAETACLQFAKRECGCSECERS